MSLDLIENNVDDAIDDKIFECLSLKKPKSFFLFAGAGSGKTRSLVKALDKIRLNFEQDLRRNKQQIAIITYTNAACDEIKYRLDFNPLFSVSTIHSFIWELIKGFNSDIKDWLRINLKDEIVKLEAEQAKSRGQNKTYYDRARRIASKTKRLERLDEIKQFIYNPKGDNISKDSLNHSEVINIGAYFLTNKNLMQNILIRKFPILLIDESQDTKEDLIDSFFEVQKKNSHIFSLGLFGDTMQRIYSEGKENLGNDLPDAWEKPAKKMNHRCSKRIITLINKIRSSVDSQLQNPRIDKEDGLVRFFIVNNSVSNKMNIENHVTKRMAEMTNDGLWDGSDQDIKILTLEHHMAAKRMGFSGIYEPLYKVDKFRTGLLDGTLPSMRLFTHYILPLIKAKQNNDEFLVSKIIRQFCPSFSPEVFKSSKSQIEIIKQANTNVNSLYSLWEEGNSPKLLDILNNVVKSKLFPIPETLAVISSRTLEEKSIAEKYEISKEGEEEDNDKNEEIDAWDLVLEKSFSEIEAYNNYVNESPKFGTHQGVKGLEFERVMAILDDDDSRGFLFSYEKLFGAKPPTPADKRNVDEGKETSVDRTRRLFYVVCSRAEKSLAIVMYTSNPELVKKNILQQKLFSEEEIEML